MMTPLVIAFTPNYFIPAATMLKSVLASSPSTSNYEVICLVSENIPERQKDKLTQMAEGRMEFKYVNLSGKLNGAFVDNRYTEAASYRLLLPEILPDYDKVIYIDCDVIVRNNLSELYYNTDLKNFLLAAVYEAPIENQSERWSAIGCDPEAYFNSGFLLMNLKKMREVGIVPKFLDALKVDYLEFPDQDVLNQVCKGQVFPLPPIYNSIRTFFLPQYKEAFLKHYLPEDWDDVQKHGNIHYTGGKPWNIHSVKFTEWWETYESLPKETKDEWSPSAKLLQRYKIERNPVAGFLINSAIKIYRTIRYR